MDDLVIVEPKDYSQVVFDDVKESYPLNIDLIVHFTLNELLKAAETDFIGIYRVGFIQSKDYYAYQIINLNEINKENNKGSIVLQADKLPKDDCEFYQFVYVSHGKQIRGASIPFMFKRSYATDFVQIDEHEAVIIKSKETELNETVHEIKLKCVDLTQANETYEKLIRENEDVITILREEISNVKSKCKNLSNENERLNSSLLKKDDELKVIEDSINELKIDNKELKELKDKFETLESDNKNLLDSLERRTNQIDLLKIEFDSMKTKKEELEQNANLKEEEIQKLRKDKEELNRLSEELQKINNQISILEKEVDDRICELNKIKVDLKQNEMVVSEQALTIQAILDERDSLSTKVENLTKEKIEIESSRDVLSNELQMTKDKLLAADECKELLKSQLFAINSELDKANLKAHSDTETITKLTGKNQRLENQNEKLVEEIKRIKIEYSTKMEESNGSYFALHVSFGHLENRIKTITQAHNRELEHQKAEIESLKQEAENLKQRVRAGALEYAALSKKYIKLKTGSEKSHQFNFDEFPLKKEKASEVSSNQCLSNSNEALFSPITINNSNAMGKKESTTKIQVIDDNAFKNSQLLASNADTKKMSVKSCDESCYIKNCEICGYIFPTDLTSTIYEDHMNSHYGLTCPVCFLNFRKDFPQNEYEDHVNNHFTN